MRLDGQWDDWADAEVTATDAVGDATSDFDLRSAAATMRGSMVHVRFAINATLNLQSGPPSQGSLGLAIELPGSRNLQLDFRQRNAVLTGDGPERPIDWPTLDFAAQPTIAADQFEIRCDLSALDVSPGDAITLQFNRGDSLDQPMRLITPAEIFVAAPEVDLAKSPDAVRIVSLNTLHQGTLDPVRSPIIERTLKQLGGDIVCFNEEWDAALFAEGVKAIFPDQDESMRALWGNGCGIATTGELTPLPFGLQRAAVGLVTLPDRDPIVVVSIHLVCCGYAGGKEDVKRIAEITNLVGQIADMRDGKFGETAAQAPIVILGDFNLVGSNTPLDLLAQIGITDVLARSLMDDSTMTWRATSPTETFWPGRLDCITVDAKRAAVDRAFLFGHDAFLATNPDWVGESIASDHAALVIDVSPAINP